MSWLFLLVGTGALLPSVPEVLTFCAMQTRIEPEARYSIQQYIIKLHEHPPTLQALVARAETLLPYIEEALQYMGVPEDLKYLAIQESRLNPNAISRSQAVGFWQLKDYTAREVGLVINDTIDERRHLFRSSAAAALYLTKQYNRHRNWLFAIIAYYEGGTGAIPYLDSAYIGKSEVCLKATTHWYALRAVAYKLTFESLIQKRIYALRPQIYQGPAIPAQQIADQNGITLEEFLKWNPWLLRPTLPASRPSTYYIPLTQIPDTLPSEPLRSLFNPMVFTLLTPDSTPAPVPVSPKDTIVSPPPKPTSAPITPPDVARLPLKKEPYLGKHWQYPPPPLTPRLRQYNPFHRGSGPILIVSPRKAYIHIVQKGETPRAIAEHYHRPLEKILAYNHISNPDSVLLVGLRVHLTKRRPPDEKPIIYSW
ncbi:MAG: transglycosylase SLT domain-containing protein [Bacteroidia bacterium]|nr:transglycosylase SLT domain-containing protein [Bacteroidia bacterium]MDW8235786.1 transglycosylase SLT domain-containing protein [Bacteroidia bacterium]